MHSKINNLIYLEKSKRLLIWDGAVRKHKREGTGWVITQTPPPKKKGKKKEKGLQGKGYVAYFSEANTSRFCSSSNSSIMSRAATT